MSAAAQSAASLPKIGPGSHFTRIEHDYWDKLKPRVSGLVEFWLVGYIQRMSVGMNRPKTEALSLQAIAEVGDCSVQSLMEAFDHALKYKLIAREKVKREYRYWACPENWEKCPLYNDLPQDKRAKKEKDNTGGPVLSGQIAPRKTAQFEIAATGHTVKVTNSSPEIGARFTVSKADAKHIHFEIEPFVEVLQFPAPKPAADSATEALRAYVQECFDSLGEPVPEPTFQKIARAVNGNLDVYRELVVKNFERARHTGKKLGAGILVYIAEHDVPARVKQGEEEARKRAAISPPLETTSWQGDEIEQIARDLDALDKANQDGALPELRKQYKERIRGYDPDKVAIARELVEAERRQQREKRIFELAEALRIASLDPKDSPTMKGVIEMKRKQGVARKTILQADESDLKEARALAHRAGA